MERSNIIIPPAMPLIDRRVTRTVEAKPNLINQGALRNGSPDGSDYDDIGSLRNLDSTTCQHKKIEKFACLSCSFHFPQFYLYFDTGELHTFIRIQSLKD